MMNYEELLYTHEIKKRLDINIEKLQEIRSELHTLGSYTLHNRLAIIVQDLYKIEKILELESGEF